MKKFVSVLMCIVLLSVFGCGKKEEAPVKKLLTPKEWSSTGLYQLTPPAKGSTIAIIHTTVGDIKIRFFEKEAPKAVKNFIALTKMGYYKNNIFFKVENDGFILTGDRTGSGDDGQSSFIAPFEDEVTPKLRAYRGAVCMNHIGSMGNLSQFSIIQCKTVSKMHLEDMKQLKYPEEIYTTYAKVGGLPLLDSKQTIFGQVIEGMEVVDKIAAGRLDKQGKPMKPEKMTSIEIVTMP